MACKQCVNSLYIFFVARYPPTLNIIITCQPFPRSACVRVEGLQARQPLAKGCFRQTHARKYTCMYAYSYIDTNPSNCCPPPC